MRQIQKKDMRKILALLCVAALVLQFGNLNAYAASISGKKGNMSISTDGSYIYIGYSGEWSNYIGEQISVSASGAGDLGALSAITINQNNDGESGSITVRNAWSSSISGASGSVSNSGEQEYYGYESMEWNIQVPVSAYSDYTFSDMTLSWGGSSVTLAISNGATTEETTTEATTEATTEERSEEATTEATTEITTETTEETTTEEGTTEETTTEEVTTEEGTTEEKPGSGDLVVTGNIQIDGMYDDWKDVPKTEITYWSNNKECRHYGQLHTDGEYLYAHFQTNELYNSPMPMNAWLIRINGHSYPMNFYYENNGTVDWGKQLPSKEGTYTGLKAFIGYYHTCDSSSVYTIYDSSHASDTPGDDFEFSISLKRLSEITGIPVEQMGTITISNPNLGNEGVSIAGSSTGPVAGVVAAFLLAAAYFKKKKGLGIE